MRMARQGDAGRLSALVACAGLVAVAVFFGGLPGDRSTVAIGLAALVAALAGAAAFGLPRLDRAGRSAVVAFGALVGWSAASLLWSIAPDRTWDATNKLAVDAAFLATGLTLAAAVRGRVSAVARTVGLVGGAALLWSLLGVAVPALAPEGDRIARLSAPIGYWNALALLAGAAIPIGAWSAAAVRPRPRVAGSLLVYCATLVIVLTQSRAGALAGLVALGATVVLAPRRAAAALQAAIASVPAVAVGAWAFTEPALVEDGAGRAARIEAGGWFAVAAVTGAVVVSVLALRLPVERLARNHRRSLGRALAATVAAIAVCGVAAFALTVGNPVTWVGDQFARGECVNDPSRFADLCANNRLSWWGEALEIAGAHAAGGTGANTFRVARAGIRETGVDVRQPHSVPLQALADLGAVGLALLVLVAFGCARAVRASIRRLDGPERAPGVALALGLVVFAIHGLVDYDADFLSLTGPALLTAGLLVGAGRPVRSARARALAIPAAAAAAVAVSLVLPWLSSRALDGADRRSGEAAVRLADRAIALNPFSFEAHLVRAEVAPDDEDAGQAYRRLAELQPENPDGWYFLGLFELALREEPDLCAAYAALNRAYTLDPNSTRWVPGGPLDQAREAVDDPVRPACGRG